jgi:adenylate cyclase
MHDAGQTPSENRDEGHPSWPEQVHAQLDHIVASPEFRVPERLRKFLRYVVETTLAGHAEQIKAYTIALEVFERDETFDAHADPVVRIEAGRLRRALERYYFIVGQLDPIQIEIPKGGYVPLFTRRTVPAAEVTTQPSEITAAPKVSPHPPRWSRTVVVVPAALSIAALILAFTYWSSTRAVPTVSGAGAAASVAAADTSPAALPDQPTLAVASFAGLGEAPEAELYAAGLTEEVLNQLAGFKELTVLGRETSMSITPQTDVTRVRRDFGARYLLEGGLRLAAGRIRVTSRLLDAGNAAVLWSQAYDADLGTQGLFAIQEDIARQVATTVAQPYGIVFRADAQRTAHQPPDDLEAYACTLRFYSYHAALGVEQHAVVRDCLRRTAAQFPGYATAWAMLSLLYLDQDRFGFNPEPGEPPPLDKALETARRAVKLDPANPRALQALMMTLFFRQEVAEALDVGERAVAINPNDTELLGEFGARVAFSGEWERGGLLLEQALARNPGHSGYYHGMLAFIAYMQRDYERAFAEIRQSNQDKVSLYHGIAAIIYARLGMTAEAAQAGETFRKMNLRFIENLPTELLRRNLRPADRVHVIEGLRLAGVPAPKDAAAAPEP